MDEDLEFHDILRLYRLDRNAEYRNDPDFQEARIRALEWALQETLKLLVRHPATAVE